MDPVVRRIFFFFFFLWSLDKIFSEFLEAAVSVLGITPKR